MKKILITASTFPRWTGDTLPMFINDLTQNLAEKYDVTVLAPHFKGAKTYETFGKVKVYRFRYALPSMETLAYGGGVVNNLNKSAGKILLLPFYVLFGILWFLFLAITKRFDVVNAHWFIPFGVPAAFFKPFFGYRLVVTSHGGDVYAVRNQKQLKFFPIKSILSFVMKQADSITLVSSGIKDFVEANYSRKDFGNKIAVVPMGIDLGRFKDVKSLSQKKKDQITLLFIGRLVEKKGVTYLIDAVKTLVDKGHNLKCLIVGDGPLREILEKQVFNAGIEKNVQFLGFIKNTEITNIIKDADICIGPSVTARDGDQEGLPVVFMEACASGLPLVVSDVPGVTDLVTDGVNGLIVPQKDSVSLASAIEKFITDDTLATTLGKNAQIKAAEFDWKVVTDKFARTYEGI